jgi:hypothetical protein
VSSKIIGGREGRCASWASVTLPKAARHKKILMVV